MGKSTSNTKSPKGNDKCSRPYDREVNPLVLIITLLAAAALSFVAGRSAVIHDVLPRVTNEEESNANSIPHDNNNEHPTISLHAGKTAPQYKYSGMEFNISSTKGSAVNTHLPSTLSTSQQVCTTFANGEKRCVIDNTINDSVNGGRESQVEKECFHDEESCTKDDSEHGEDEEEEHLPAGQHLLVDIKNVDSEFLNSDVRLAKAMVDVVNLSQLTLLSYHCHNLIPQGVSCVGVLLESHISFHTWPEAGVITLDLFTCGSGKLVPLVPIVERLFAVPAVGSLVKPFTRWVHKLRGFRPEDYEDILTKDLGYMLGEVYDIKKEIVSVQTSFQRIDVFDVQSSTQLDPQLIKNPSYRETHPKLFEPERILYLDGIIQSTLKNIEAYHEALVHPAMFTHKNPKRVAIIGGGEGTTLKEVLKHNTLEKVQMVEIDKEMVMTSKDHLPEWSDCSDIIGSAKWCGDDKRAEMHYEDALGWFIDRYSESGKLYHENHPKLDVIIMDALDPQDDIPFAELLYTDETFLTSLYNSLGEDGMIVFQLGEAPDHSDPPDELNNSRRRSILMDKLQDLGFLSFHIYEDGHCGFEYPWTFFVVMKDERDRASWFRNTAETQIAIHERSMRTHSGKPVLGYFDGAVMRGYQIPHKVFQTIFCRQENTSHLCNFETIKDVKESDLEVKSSSIGDGSGRGVFTKVDIEKGMSIGKESSVNPLIFPPSTTALIMEYHEDIEGTSIVYDYMDGYGWQVRTFGKEAFYVDSSILTFVNHGCNGTYNVVDSYYVLSDKERVTEQNAKESDYFDFFEEEEYNSYNPYRLRHIHHANSNSDYSLSDIKAGEELFVDYLMFCEGTGWWDDVQHLKRMCNGEEFGFIAKREGHITSTLDKSEL